MRTTTKWITAVVAAVTLACAVPALWLRHGYHEAKDRRDLMDLTRGWNRPLGDLPVPDELPADRVTGEVSAYGLRLWYPAAADPGADPIAYAVLLTDGPDEPLWTVDCDATVVVVCTDLGDGYTLLHERDTDNSDPGTTVRRRVGDLMFEARVLGDHPEMVPRLRRIITETHAPDDAELLRFLRPDGYQTDWS
ncbi:hypothetical protein [Actinoplanes utahensis]|nr:hypothetical protein [Actinoplanes utahensis]GIF29717.1 hypothetical protein Aut01nite_27030 [Actinoplanes utahensis]